MARIAQAEEKARQKAAARTAEKGELAQSDAVGDKTRAPQWQTKMMSKPQSP